MTEPVIPESRPHTPRWLTIVCALVAVVALFAAGLAFNAYRNERDRADDLASQVAGVRERIRQLEAEADERDSTNPFGDLDDLFGDGLLDGLDDLLGGGGGALGRTAQCLGGGDLGSLFGGGADIPDDDPDAQYEAVARWVEDERELEFTDLPAPTYVSADEMARRVEAQIRADYPADEVRADTELFVALGILPEGADLLEEYSAFVGSQVAGYYDPDTGELVVLGDGTEPFDAIELATIAHELEHALADQALDLPIDDDVRGDDPDRQLAQLGLVEGDATLTMSRFQLAATNPLDLLGALGSGELERQQEALENAPEYFAQQLLFPYTEGLAFVCALEADGGWDAVDAAYADPPTTTAQILFPERYLRGEDARDVPDPRAPDGPGWEEVRRITFGAADVLFLMDRDAAEQWAGGELAQFRNGDRTAVRINLAARSDDRTLCDAVTKWVDSLDARAKSASCANEQISVAIG